MARFKKLIVDCDKPLLAAAAQVQENYVIVTNKHNGEKREFPTATKFWGHWKKKAGGELADWSKFLGCDHISSDDFEIEQCARPHPDLEDHVAEAEKLFGYFVAKIKRANLADDYELAIHGEGNFRYDVAHINPYKMDRPEKPLFFLELKEKILSQYKHKVHVVNGIEVDDYVSCKGWENFHHYNRTGEWKYLLAYQDKDLSMTPSPKINYDKIEEGIEYITPEKAAHAYASQLLTGDFSCDKITGLPNLAKEFKEKYNLGKHRGVGAATAEAVLKDCTIKEMFSRVVEAYQMYYGIDTVHEFTSHRGEEMKYTWIDYLNERAKLLYMLRKEDEVYDIRHTLDRLGIEY